MMQLHLTAARAARAKLLLPWVLGLLASSGEAQNAGPLPLRAPIGIDTDCRPYHVLPAEPLTDIDLSSYIGCSAGSALPWSAAFAPDRSSVYVSLFGGTIGGSGCLIVRIDPNSKAVLSAFSVDEGPEEIVFTTRPDGTWRHGWVSCSSASSVVVFDRSNHVVASIAIPFASGSGWSTAFPFGLAVSPDQSCVYVGTLDGSGKIWVIDAISRVLLPSETVSLGVGRGFGRLCFADDDLVVPSTLFHSGWQGSTAEVFFVDPADPGGATRIELATSSSSFLFPSPQDVALLCDGRLFVAGFDMGANLFVFDAPTRSLLRTLPTFTSQPDGKFQSLGLSSRGLLAVADYWTNELTLYDAWREEWLGLVDSSASTAYHAQLNELVFDPDGRELWVPSFASENLAVLSVQ